MILFCRPRLLLCGLYYTVAIILYDYDYSLIVTVVLECFAV